MFNRDKVQVQRENVFSEFRELPGGEGDYREMNERQNDLKIRGHTCT